MQSNRYIMIQSNTILPSMSMCSKLSLSLRSPIETLYTTLLSPIRATCPAHLIILDLITRIIFSVGYKSLSSSLRSLILSPVTSSLLSQNSFSPPYYRTPSTYVSHSSWETKLHTVRNATQNYISLYLDLYVSGEQTGKQKILHRMFANISWFQSALKFSMNGILTS